jgi:hypothetical protein
LGPAPGKLQAPAIALNCVGGIDLLFALYGLTRNLLGMNPPQQQPPPGWEGSPELMQFFELLQGNAGPINLVMSVCSVLAGVLIILGGIQMLRMRSYALAVAGSVLSAIPCLSLLACCGIGEGVGLWALVVLLSADIKQLFE